MRLSELLAARMASPTEQVIVALKRLSTANARNEPVGLKRRRLQLRALAHLDRAAQRAGLDPLASRLIWTDVTDGRDPGPSVRAYARDLVRGDNLKVEQKPRRTPLRVPAGLAGAGAVLASALVAQGIPRLVELALARLN
ncbi:hypothetical protein [Cellulomonas sp. Y8]|uniref:hypothetical protein n=1 Tax=Cellulomonas sp. Y8 TaxID=2591145 RepID=UPI003D7155A7